MHGEHRALAEKVLPYEPSIRIPLVMRGPGIPRGRTDPRLVGNLDVPATILDATGVSPGRPQDGRSLLDLVDDPGEEWGRDLLIENGNGANGVPTYRGIRTYRFLYVDHRTTGERELYDLVEDPFQLQSVDGQDRYRKVQRDFATRLRSLRTCAGASCQTHPRLKLVVRSGGRPLTGCVRSGLVLRVRGSKRDRPLSADFLVGSRRVASVHGDLLQPGRPASLVKEVRPGDLRRRGRFRLRVRAETEDGRRYTLDRTLRACR